MILETLPTATQLLKQCWSIGQRFVCKTFSSRKKWAISLQKEGRKIFTCLEGRDLPGVQHAQDPGLPLSNNLSRVLKSKVYHVSAVSMSKSENISFLHTFYKIWFCVHHYSIKTQNATRLHTNLNTMKSSIHSGAGISSTPNGLKTPKYQRPKEWSQG